MPGPTDYPIYAPDLACSVCTVFAHFFGVRWLDAALAVPFFLSAPPTAIAQNAKLTQNESGVKPPHSKTR
jgi:hypothetical protein